MSVVLCDVHSSNILQDENQKLRTKITTLNTKIHILKQKELILTDLFEAHKAKYDQMQIHFDQKYEILKLSYQQIADNLQKQIEHQDVKLKQKQMQIEQQSSNFSASISKYKQSIKLLNNQINIKDRKINKLNEEISDIQIELSETNRELLQKDVTINNVYQGFMSDEYYINNANRPLSATTTKVMCRFSGSVKTLSVDGVSNIDSDTIISHRYRNISNMLSPLLSLSHDIEDELNMMAYDSNGSEERNRSRSAHVIRNSKTEMVFGMDDSEMFVNKSV